MENQKKTMRLTIKFPTPTGVKKYTHEYTIPVNPSDQDLKNTTSKLVKISEEPSTNKPPMAMAAFLTKEKEQYEARLSASSAKLKERYAEVQRQKLKRKVEVLDIKNLPKPTQSKFPCSRSRTRTRR